MHGQVDTRGYDTAWGGTHWCGTYCIPIPPPRVDSSKGPPRKNRQNFGTFLDFSVHGKNGLRWPQIGPEGFFPTNPDLADILGRTDLNFENLCFLLIFWTPHFWISRSPDLQISGFPDPQISKFPDLQIARFPGSQISRRRRPLPILGLPLGISEFSLAFQTFGFWLAA